MKSIFTVLVILYLFVTKAKTKDFCESFRDNKYRVDLSLDYKYNVFDDRNYTTELLLIIGSDYWRLKSHIDIPGDSVYFVSNESRSHNLFDSRYSATFAHRMNEGNAFTYGFIRNDSRVKWKVLTTVDPWNLKVVNESNFTTDPQLPQDFESSAAFVFPNLKLLDSQNNPKLEKYIVFIDQKPETNSKNSRRYYTKFLSNSSTEMFPRLDSEFIDKREKTQLNYTLIGSAEYWDGIFWYRIILYSSKNKIHYCKQTYSIQDDYDNISEFVEKLVRERCSDELYLLIECQKQTILTTTLETTFTTTLETDPSYDIWFSILIGLIILLIIVVLAIIGCCIFSQTKAVKKFVPFSDSISSTSSMSSTLSSVKTVDSETGNTLESELKPKSSKTKQKK